MHKEVSMTVLFRLAMASIAMLLALPGHAEDKLPMSKGAYLAKVGDCVSCHSAPHGKEFAGGLPMLTPMGAIYTTNITPDPDTGIGRYSEAEFARALRKGVAKDGHHLYPAMPYPSYSKVSDQDIHELYNYFMKEVTPVKQANKPSDIPWPLNMRWPLALWNMVFLNDDVYKSNAKQDASWNRGAYLVQGLGHCGACHTPRGLAFQEKALDERSKKFLTGATLEGWSATNLAGDHNTGLGRWSAGDIVTYLKYGSNQHSSAFGTMTTVINNSTEAMSIPDLTAIANYLKTLPATGDKKQAPYTYQAETTLAQFKQPTKFNGARLYAQYCLDCHTASGKGVAPYLAPLAGNPPYNMPRFRTTLNDQQIAELVSFMQSSWNHQLPATSSKQVAKIRNLLPSAH